MFRRMDLLFLLNLNLEYLKATLFLFLCLCRCRLTWNFCCRYMLPCKQRKLLLL